MCSEQESDTDELIQRARDGDDRCVQQLLQRHRNRLRRMVELRMDGRIAARVDPSDIVQDALLEASRRLPKYLRTQPIPYYPWLRQIAWERLVQLHRRHVESLKRSVNREAPAGMMLADRSVCQLIDRIAAAGSSPSRQVLREEMRDRVRAALEGLKPDHREVLVLRYLEQMSVREIAAVMGISTGAVHMRQLRALELLRATLHDLQGGSA